MFDRKTEANEFVGETVEAASEEASRFYGVDAAELKVAVQEEVSGAGGRTVVVAWPKNFKPSPSRDDRGGSGGGRSDRGGRGRSRDGDSRRRRGGDSRGGDSRGGDSRNTQSAAPQETEEAKPSKGTPRGKMSPVGDFVLGALERMGMGNFEIQETAQEDSNFLVYQISGEASEALGGSDGRAADALQLLANQVARLDDENPPRVVIEVEGASEQRAESLQKLAERAAVRALESGRALALDAMNGRDRRVVHLALKERADIATMGIGDGRYRQVLVVPEGAPEYEDAVESARNAN